MSDFPLENLQEVAKAIRGLSADAVQKANSGHPGLPLGCAEMGAALYGGLLNHDPEDPSWANRDRFILSAGHGSMLLYSCLHLAGYSVSLDEVKNFRQWDSATPGHPEYGHTPGVECTTGPLGQGIANGVGMAIAAKTLANRFNTKDYSLIDHQVVVLCGDGCLMEGISYEAASLAGHLGLDNFILIYDSNDISLDAPTDVSFTEDTTKRFEAAGFAVQTVDGHDLSAFATAYAQAKENDQPSLIVARTTIGKGAPNKEGTQKTHGAPLGEEEVRLMKEKVGLPQDDFYISGEVENFFSAQRNEWKTARLQWEELFANWSEENPALRKQWDQQFRLSLPSDLEGALPNFEVGQGLATRKASQQALQVLAEKIPHLIGGSADLSCSNLTNLDAYEDVQKNCFHGRNIYFGVREHAMGAIANGLSYYGGLIPFCATFLVFADYLRPAIRLAALTKRKVLFVFTHDSFMVGEDGPTHQPVETLASLRCLPGLTTYRPADANEVNAVYLDALQQDGPSAICLTRHGVTNLKETKELAAPGVSRGAYIVHREAKGELDHVIFASGSEVEIALGAAQELEKKDLGVRVISVPSFEKFDQQEEAYRKQVLSFGQAQVSVIEAQVSFGWHKYVGTQANFITMETFGASAPGKVLQEKFGFTVNQVVLKILREQEMVSQT